MKKIETDLLNLLSAQKKPLKSIELANALGISSRSVKNYVSRINEVYKKKIILSSRNGYELNRQISTGLLFEKDTEQIPQTTEERAFYMIKQLVLYHTSRLDLFDLCDYLCVGYSTIKAVISAMNKMFSSYHVKFVCENDCVKIVADEKSKRKLISYVINEESQTSFMDTRQLQECFPDLDVSLLRKIILSILKKHNYYLNDFAAVNLILHLLIIIDREKNGNPLDAGTADFQIENEYEYNLITELCSELETGFHITLSSDEHNEIYMLFKANANYSLPSTPEALEKMIGPEILSLTHYYIRQINSLYLIDLGSNSFHTAFSLHLKNLLFRARHGSFTCNPMTDSIRLNNPIVFDIAIYIGLDISERYGVQINEDEIAFLAMHVGSEIERQNINRSKVPCALLCPNYRNMNTAVINQLLLNFGSQIDISTSAHTEEELKDQYFAILFTTLPLTGVYPCRVVSISPFDIPSQYEMIREAITTEQDRYKNSILKNNFSMIFHPDLFVANPGLRDKEDYIHCLCEKLLAKNYISPDFEEHVLRRENAATTAFGNIAIPHSVEMDAIKTSIAVAVSKEGFLWGTSTVHLVLLLAINRADKKTFRNLYESLISLFGIDHVLSEVRSCSSFKEFEILIYNYIDVNRKE